MLSTRKSTNPFKTILLNDQSEDELQLPTKIHFGKQSAKSNDIKAFSHKAAINLTSTGKRSIMKDTVQKEKLILDF